MNQVLIGALASAVSTAALATFGWFLRQGRADLVNRMTAVVDKVDEIKRDLVNDMASVKADLTADLRALDGRVNTLEAWRSFHLEVTHGKDKPPSAQ